MKMNKNAVVTGATGAIGTALIRLLLENGYHVYAIVRPQSPRNENLKNSLFLTKIECNLSEISSITEKISEECAVFFHLAWNGTFGSVRNDMTLQTENILSAVNAVETAHQLGCQVFVGAGSQAEYGRKDHALTPSDSPYPENGYGMAKLCAGQMTRKIADSYGMKHLWFRILSVYGMYDNENSMIMTAIRQFLSGNSAPFTKGEQLWDYLYSEDCAKALLMGAERSPHSAVYCLGSGQALPLAEYIAIIRDCINPAIPLRLGEIPYYPEQVMCLYADISDLTKDTGFIPKTDFATGIQKLTAWYRKELAK